MKVDFFPTIWQRRLGPGQKLSQKWMTLLFGRIFPLGLVLGLFWYFLFGLCNCAMAPMPLEDFATARSAMDAARSVDAGRYAPTFWAEAESSYARAQKLFNDREYSKARDEFIHAREVAEKAENTARTMKHRNGEVTING